MPIPCPCGAPRHEVWAPAVERSGDGVSMRLDGVGAWRCEAGHVVVVDDGIIDRLSQALADQLLVATNRPLRRHDACGDCEAVLTLPGRVTETPVVDDTGPTVVTLTPTAEMLRCPNCGREQLAPITAAALVALLPALVGDLGDAIAPTGGRS